MVAPGNACSTARSPRPRARNVRRTGLRITADAGDKYEAGDTRSSRLPCERLRASLVHGFERYAGGLDIGGNGVDYGIDSCDGGNNRGLVAHVGTKDRDPVQARRAQSGARAIGMSDRDADRRSRVSEALHNAPTEEAGAPEHAYRGHGINASGTSVATLRVQVL